MKTMAFGCIRGSSFDENLKLAMLQDIFKYAKINSRILHELDRIKEDWLSLGTELKERLQAQVSVFGEKKQKKKKQSKSSSSSNSNSSNQSNRISDIRTRRKKYKKILNRIIKWKYIGDESLVIAELDASIPGREEEKEVSKNQSKTKKKSIMTQHETKLENFQDLVYYHNFFTHTVQQLFHHHHNNNEGEYKYTKEEQTRHNFVIQSLLQNLRIIHQSLLDIISVVRDLLVENDNSLLLLFSMYNDLINNTNVNGITVNDSAALLVSTSTGSLSSSFSGLEGEGRAQAQRPQSPQPHSSIISSAALSNLSPTPSFTSWNSISCKRVLYSDYTDKQTNFFFNSDTNQNIKVLETAAIQIQKQNQGENDNGVQYLLSGHDDGKIKIFDITNYLSPPKDSNHTKKKKQKKKDSCVVATLRGHSKTILSLSVHKTNDAYYLVSSSIDGTINVYNLDHSSSRFDLISTLYFSWNNITECHSLTTTLPILREKTKEKDSDDDVIVQLITTRLKSFQTSNNNNNKNNNTNCKSSLFCPIQKQQKKNERIKKSNDDSDKTNSISTFLMCSVSEDYCIHIWDPISQTLLHTFDEAHSDTIFTICIFYRPSASSSCSGGDGGSGSNHLHPYLASGSFGFGRDNIKIWDLETYTLLQTLHLPRGHHSSGVKSITIFSSLLDSFSSSSSSSLTILADARLDKRIHLWRLKEENEHSFRTITDSNKGGGKFTYMTTLVGHNNPIHSIDFIQVQGNLCLLSTTNNDHGVYNDDDDDDDIEDIDEEEEKNHNDEVGKLFVWNLGRSPFNVNKMMPIPTKINVTNNNSESLLFNKRKNPLLLKIIPSVYLSNNKDSDNNGGGRSLDNSNTSATSTKKQRACILTTLNDGEIYFWME